MVNVFSGSPLYAPLLVLAVSWLILGPLLGLVLPAPHRRRGPAAYGRKVPPPLGRHLDTAPITLPVTGIISIPQPEAMLVIPDPADGVVWDELLGKGPYVPLQTSRRPTYLKVPGFGSRLINRPRQRPAGFPLTEDVTLPDGRRAQRLLTGWRA